MQTFEDLLVWQKARKLYNTISEIFEVPEFRAYFFRDQILRAALSISNNIAEWYERETNNELKRFLYIARGSAWEVRSMLHIAKDKHYIDDPMFEILQDDFKHVSIMLFKLIQKIS